MSHGRPGEGFAFRLHGVEESVFRVDLAQNANEALVIDRIAHKRAPRAVFSVQVLAHALQGGRRKLCSGHVASRNEFDGCEVDRLDREDAVHGEGLVP
ncbi:hypothetical protein D3C78_1655630 [compost metagenome]